MIYWGFKRKRSLISLTYQEIKRLSPLIFALMILKQYLSPSVLNMVKSKHLGKLMRNFCFFCSFQKYCLILQSASPSKRLFLNRRKEKMKRHYLRKGDYLIGRYGNPHFFVSVPGQHINLFDNCHRGCLQTIKI